MPPLVENQPPQKFALAGLALAQCLGSFGQLTMATLGGIVGALLAPSMELATVPITVGIAGVATAAWPLAKLRQRVGSRVVFIGTLIWAALGAALAAFAITRQSFVLFSAAMFMVGNNMATTAQYRFAATELAPARMAGLAISIVMVGTLVAAALAPWIAIEFRDLLDVDYAGSFAVLVIAYLAGAAVFAFLPLRDGRFDEEDQEPAPALRSTLQRAPVQLAIVAAAASYGVMSLIMTATPISMHFMDLHSAEATAGVIRAHLLAMFAPSLISGWLISRLGLMRMLGLGIALNFACIGVAISGNELWHYRAALILLGAGWNFLFVGGTALLTQVCSKAESGNIQGFNDLVMFGTMGVAALSAGGLLSFFGWRWTNLAGALVLGLVLIALIRAAAELRELRRSQRLAA